MFICGPEIKAFRERYGLTQQDVARLTGYSQQYLSSFERRGSPPPKRVHDALMRVVKLAPYIRQVRLEAEAEKRQKESEEYLLV